MQTPSRMLDHEVYSRQTPGTILMSKTPKTIATKSSRASRKELSARTRDRLASATETMNSEERQELERQQSAAARRIIQEANKAAILDTFDEWQSKAEEIVNISQCIFLQCKKHLILIGFKYFLSSFYFSRPLTIWYMKLKFLNV